MIAADGPKAAERFFTFFTDNIRNQNTRAAYYRNTCRLFAWCEARGLVLHGVRSYHVSAYVEELGQRRAVLNSARHCLDYDFLRRNPDYRHLVAYIDTGPHNWLNFNPTDTGWSGRRDRAYALGHAPLLAYPVDLLIR